jgi:hypothetical protein
MVAWLAAFCILTLASSAAWAKKRVVVLDFSGPQAGKAESAVIAAVKKKHTVVSAGQYTKAQKKLKAKKQTNKNVAKVAAEIQVDAVVTGVMKKKGGKWTLTVTVREGASGKVKGTAKIILRAPRMDARAKEDIDDKVLPIIGKVRSIAGGEADAGGDDSGGGDDEVASNDEGGGDDEGSSDEEEKPKKGKGGGDESAESGGGDSGEEEAAPGVDDEKTVASNDEANAGGDSAVTKSTGGDGDGDAAGGIAGTKYARHGAFQLEVGMSAIGRSLTFTTKASLAATEQPNGYDGAIVPGGMVMGELYPLAFGNPRGALAGIGLTFVFDRVFLLKSKYGTDEYDTTQQRFGVGLRYRLPIGKSATGPTLHVGIGYNKLSFVIDDSAAVMPIGLPDVDYTYIDPGLGVRLPLGTPKFALLADAKYMVVLDSGDMQAQANYGTGTVSGLDVDAGLEFRVMPRLPLHLGFHYIRVAYDFDGSGTQTNRDAEAGQDVGGALDVYLGGYVSAGYIF